MPRQVRDERFSLLNDGRIRHPIYAGNFLVGLGMIFVSEAFILTPLFVALFALQYRIIVSAEEEFLRETFGDKFDFYRLIVLKYVATIMPSFETFSHWRHLPLKEHLGTAAGLIAVAYVLEWLESPLHRRSIVDLFQWVAPRISL